MGLTALITKPGMAFWILRARVLKAFHCLQASMWREGMEEEDEVEGVAFAVAFALLVDFLATDFF